MSDPGSPLMDSINPLIIPLPFCTKQSSSWQILPRYLGPPHSRALLPGSRARAVAGEAVGCAGRLLHPLPRRKHSGELCGGRWEEVSARAEASGESGCHGEQRLVLSILPAAGRAAASPRLCPLAAGVGLSAHDVTSRNLRNSYVSHPDELQAAGSFVKPRFGSALQHLLMLGTDNPHQPSCSWG